MRPPRCRAVRTVRLVSPGLAVLALLVGTAGAQTQTNAQQACINGLNKAGASVAATQGKRNVSCLKEAGRGREPDAQACLAADPKLALAKAAAKTVTTFTKKCAVAPDFGSAPVTTINAAAQDEEIALVAAIFGGDLGAAAVLQDADKVAAGCQLAVARAYERLAAANLKRVLRCKKSGLAAGTITSAVTLAGCFDGLATDTGVVKAGAKLFAEVTKKCGTVDVAATFPGTCAFGGVGAFTTCVIDRVDCHVCSMLDAMDGLARDCDVYDDGAANGSCATVATPTPTPTATATVTATPTPGPTPTCGGTIYEEDFAVANGSPWPAPWTAIGSVDVADVQSGRARFRPTLSGYSLARLFGGLDEQDVEARFTVEFENIGQQGVGFYVRQNGGYLQQSTPHGQGYAVFVEGFRGFQGIGVWREVDGVEQQLLIDMGQTIANGTRYRVRFQVEQATPGTTDLRAKMWPEAGMEPAGWDVEFTDNTGVLQNVSGGIAADSWSSLTTGGATPAYTFIDDVEVLSLCE